MTTVGDYAMDGIGRGAKHVIDSNIIGTARIPIISPNVIDTAKFPKNRLLQSFDVNKLFVVANDINPRVPLDVLNTNLLPVRELMPRENYEHFYVGQSGVSFTYADIVVGLLCVLAVWWLIVAKKM